MKRILIAMLTAATFASCQKTTVNVNSNNGNGWSQPSDSLMHVTGKVNTTTLVESSTYKVGPTTPLTLEWPALPAGCSDVQVSVYLYDGANNNTPLWQDSRIVSAKSYAIIVPTHHACITATNKALLQIVVIPLACSGKEAVQYNVYLCR